jgi:ketosteroid isomerase-like protein
MKIPQPLFLLALAALHVCPARAADVEARTAELVLAEAALLRHLSEHGFGAGVAAFMADDAMIANSLTLGRDAQAARPKSDPARARDRALAWKPLRAEVAASGDLGYTWGVAESAPAKAGPFRPYGIYVVVWKRQADGQWKFVYDALTAVGAEAIEKFVREKFPAAPSR